jgi:ubiquinone biosynthesis protein
MLWELLSATRDLGRLHEIGGVLVRHGFGDAVRRLGLARVIERAGRVLPVQALSELARLDPAGRLRAMCEELGPTFVKLGQLLATRVDMLPPSYIAEFEKLRDAVAPVAFDALRLQLEEDLGAPLESVFAWLDEAPLAGASIAQVHAGRLHDGSEVVLKVRRPGIAERVAADLRLLARLAEVAERELPELRFVHPRQVVRQLERALRDELDLAREARNAERIAEGLAGDPQVVIPAMHPALRHERFNVQERIVGWKGSELAAAAAAGIDTRSIARTGARAVAAMVLRHGFFHADPHPGNCVLLPGDRLALLDFGMVGRLSASRRAELTRLLLGVVNSDGEGVAEVLSGWTVEGPDEPAALQREVEEFLDAWQGVPLRELRVGDIVQDLTVLLRGHRLSLPPDLALLTKALLTLEAFGRQLDPAFDFVAEARPLVVEAMRARVRPRQLRQRLRARLQRALSLSESLPRDAGAILRALRSGQLRVRILPEGADELRRHLDRAASTLTVGVVIAALIVGTAIVLTQARARPVFGMPLAEVGFALSFVGGLWVLFRALRRG